MTKTNTYVDKTTGETKTLLPFIKFGKLDVEALSETLAPKKVKEIVEDEQKFGTIRLDFGQVLTGKISGIYAIKNQQCLYLSEIKIDDVELQPGAAKIGITTAMNSLLTEKKKVKGDTVTIICKGKKLNKEGSNAYLDMFVS